jgi:hypothetical protein
MNSQERSKQSRARQLRGFGVAGLVGLTMAAACGDAGVGSGSQDVSDTTVICDELDAEPNHGEASAERLNSTNDCDGNGTAAQGTLAGSRDIDWYYFEGFDVGYCKVNPTIELDAPDADTRVCAFFTCVEGELEPIDCPSGTARAESPDGRAGCCGAVASMTVSGLDCEGTSYEDIDVFIRVDRPDSDAEDCSDYTLSYHY